MLRKTVLLVTHYISFILYCFGLFGLFGGVFLFLFMAHFPGGNIVSFMVNIVLLSAFMSFFTIGFIILIGQYIIYVLVLRVVEQRWIWFPSQHLEEREPTQKADEKSDQNSSSSKKFNPILKKLLLCLMVVMVFVVILLMLVLSFEDFLFTMMRQNA